MKWEMHMVVLWVWVDIKDSSIHFGAIAGSFSLYLDFLDLYLCLTTSLHSVLTVDNMCCAFLKQKENVWSAVPNMRDWKKGERRAGDCISPNGQWNESQYCGKRKRPVSSQHTGHYFRRTLFYGARSVLYAHSGEHSIFSWQPWTIESCWRSVWKLRCVSFEIEVTPGHHLQTK